MGEVIGSQYMRDPDCGHPGISRRPGGVSSHANVFSGRDWGGALSDVCVVCEEDQ